MQAIRQSLMTARSQSKALIGPLSIVQQIRWDGSDPKTSTSSENHKSKDLNKTKGGNKKQRSTSTDDTNQPGTTRKDWSKPDQVVGNDPQYGTGSSPPKDKNSK